MQKKGYIKLYRSSLEHFLYKEHREFSRWEAWEWLLLNAVGLPEGRTVIVRKRPIRLERGQLSFATEFLRRCWGWRSKSKVKRFLDLLIEEGMIKTDSANYQLRIEIVNYSERNPIQEQNARITDNQPIMQNAESETERKRNDSRTIVERKQNDSRTKSNKGEQVCNEVNKGNKGENQNFPSNPDLNNQISDLEKKIGGIHFKNFNAADNRNKIDGLRRVALFDWLRYVNEGGITRLTSFQIEKLIGRFNEFDAAKIAALVANMITEGQRGIYFDRIKNQKNGTQKRKAESWENKW